MSILSPLNRLVPKIRFTYVTCPDHHLWMTKFRAWWLLNRSYLVHHLWTTDSQVFLFCLLLCPVYHLWTVNTLNLIISNRLCPVHHLWIDEYPISPFFVIMFSSSPLNGKTSCLVILNQLCPVRHLWTDRYLDLTFKSGRDSSRCYV